MTEFRLKAKYRTNKGGIISVSICTNDYMQYAPISEYIRKQEVISWKESAREIEE
jgi:hypothetical protein